MIIYPHLFVRDKQTFLEFVGPGPSPSEVRTLEPWTRIEPNLFVIDAVLPRTTKLYAYFNELVKEIEYVCD